MTFKQVLVPQKRLSVSGTDIADTFSVSFGMKVPKTASSGELGGGRKRKRGGNARTEAKSRRKLRQGLEAKNPAKVPSKTEGGFKRM